MKMICPHCGVKGSAVDSLLNRKVKCPKCTGIFVVNADVVAAIPVDAIELEVIDEGVEVQPGAGSAPVADIIDDDIFGEKGVSAFDQDELGESEIDRLLADGMEDEEEVVAALADYDQDGQQESELPGGAYEEEEEDTTLTVIEDFPVDAFDSSTTPSDGEEEEISLEDHDPVHEPDQLDWQDDGSDNAEAEDDDESVPEEEDGDSILEFDDDLADQLEAGESGEEGEREEEDLSFDDFDHEADREDVDIWADEAGEEEQHDAEEHELTAEEAEAELKDVETETLAAPEDEATPQGLDQEESAGEEPGTNEEEKSEEVVQKCSACGEYVDQSAKYKLGSNVYCDKCVPRREKKSEADNTETETETEAAAATATAAAATAAVAAATGQGRFTLSTLIKDAWRYTRGVKASMWGAFIVMGLVLSAIGMASGFAFPQAFTQQPSMNMLLVNAGVQIVVGILSYVLGAGIILMAIRRIGGQDFSWKMVFSGFSKAWSLALLYILQMIMLFIGFCLLIIPGIYLSVGYMLAIPLVVVEGMSPWQAMETSRKAIHTRWWTVFLALIVMGILAAISAIPAGIGLIWTGPMFVVLVGILYYHFFGEEEDPADEEGGSPMPLEDAQ